MASFNDLFEQVIRERIYEKNIAPKIKHSPASGMSKTRPQACLSL
jgi:hypothetical protein